MTFIYKPNVIIKIYHKWLCYVERKNNRETLNSKNGGITITMIILISMY